MAKHKSYAVGIGHFNRKAFLDVLIYFSQKQDEYNIRFINLEKFKQINKENEKSF